MGGAPGRLWVVATPIGNLEDITVRALRVLREADGVLAEDTRHTRALLAHHAISTPLDSFHAHTTGARLDALVERLRQGARLALVTDAGSPVVSDPGAALVSASRDAGIPVEAVPGPSAVTAALGVAGLRVDGGFRFVGFLPRTGGKRRDALTAIAADPGATVLFESPRRLGRTLADLAALAPERPAAVCRELTKVHEEVVRGSLADLSGRFAGSSRGEVTVVVGAVAPAEALQPAAPAADELSARARELLAEGIGTREAARRLAAETGLSRRAAYDHVLKVTR